MIPLSNLVFDDEMKGAAIEALQNEHFVLGESVFKFEEEFARYCGVKHAVSTSSGSSALQLSLIGAGIRKGAVITTALSFIMTANAILHAGATPSFVDIDLRTCNIDPEQVAKWSERPKAIIPVHLWGHPADMAPIMETAKENGAIVIEDACQAHGAEYGGKKTGAIGDIGCFSFYSSKNMTVCGDGGMVVTDNEKLAETVSSLRDCGKPTYDLVGYTARMNTVNAAIGRVQLRKLDRWNKLRRSNAKIYDQLLSEIDMVRPPLGARGIKSVFHMYVIRVRHRDELKEWLEKNNIQCGIHYPTPIPLQPAYQKVFGAISGEYPHSELASETCLSLPMYPHLKKEEIKYVCEKISGFY